MLLKNEKLSNNTQVGIWRIEETPDYFLNRMNITEGSLAKIAKMNERRKTEWLAARHLLQQMMGNHVFCYSDEFGKPVFQDGNRQLSISHSRGLATVVVSDKAIGVDIQEIAPKIKRIAHKFMREEETESLNEASHLQHLHIYWGAKEALYKAYGKRGLDFRRHILVDPFDYLPTEVAGQAKGKTTGKVIKEDYNTTFDIYFEEIENHFLVFAEAK